MSVLPTFELFPDPIREGSFKPSAAACTLCGLARGMEYCGPQYGEWRGPDPTICPWCISDGTASSRGLSFNDATVYPWKPETRQMPHSEKEMVEDRTPGFSTWQGNRWLMCCDRACVYLGQAEAGELEGRYASAVPSMFEGDGYSQTEMDEIVKQVRRNGHVNAYIFRCRVCSSLKAYWDCD